MILIGFFEGIPSDRGIAWRCADSRSLATFLGYAMTESTPDHSTLSGTRRRLPTEWHEEAFALVLAMLAKRGLLKGQTLGIDASTIDANASLKALEHKVTAEAYDAYVKRLAEESGIASPTKEELARFDKKRKGKKTSNKDWQNPHDPDAKIGKTKDGRFRMIHKPEHAVDMDTGAIVAAPVHPADEGDTTTGPQTLAEASENLDRVMNDVSEFQCSGTEVVGDKGYHSDEVLGDLADDGYRSYIAEPDRGERKWADASGHVSEEKQASQHALYGNRRRIKGNRGKALLRKRGELIERSFTHVLDSGGQRRTTLRGLENVNKRYTLQAAAFNLSLVMRKLLGAGKPRALAAQFAALLATLLWSILQLLMTWRYRGNANAAFESRAQLRSANFFPRDSLLSLGAT